MSSIKLLTLNIEENLHLDLIRDFIAKEKPEVWCAQEIFTKDIELFKEEFGFDAVSIPTMLKSSQSNDPNSEITEQHTAIFSTLPLSNAKSLYYYSPSDELKVFDNDNKRSTIHQGLISCTVTKDSDEYNIVSTHFTVTPDGLPDRDQEVDMKSFLKSMESFPEVILCGDFNIPRHYNKLYEVLSDKYADNIPVEYTHSLDTTIHRLGSHETIGPHLETLMVDYIFSTPQYRVSNVKRHCGISDHCGFTGEVSKVVQY